jgi:uncharacterized protein YutD
LIRTQAGTYEVIEENRDGWNPEAFKERYSDILDKYDYIVGDWGYGQLRLRGFYENSNRKVPFEQRIAALDEYLQEYCNFGCPYFVLRKVKSAQPALEESSGAEESSAEYDTLEPRRGDVQHGERRERRRFHPRHNRPERTERGERQGGQQGERQARNERGDKPKNNKNEQHKAEKQLRDGGKERRNQQLRTNRDKVPAGPSTDSKRE